jgi:hypothetical protein
MHRTTPSAAIWARTDSPLSCAPHCASYSYSISRTSSWPYSAPKTRMQSSRTIWESACEFRGSSLKAWRNSCKPCSKFWSARGHPFGRGVVENSTLERVPKTWVRIGEAGISLALQHHKTRSISCLKPSDQMVASGLEMIIYLLRGSAPRLCGNLKCCHCEPSLVVSTPTRICHEWNKENRKDFGFERKSRYGFIGFRNRCIAHKA